ncbi:WxL domain-containing protein [Bhargavaea massiliensis]|uniref:WxL domain-containing protein n=1 Tax=Bhargavaea massiliensis TaxID=2697500 RepID=UPI001F26140E|nr:WxL domain-containing protein [Bhargavaea massiliensis]
MKHTWKVAALSGGILLFGFGTSSVVASTYSSEATIHFETLVPEVKDPETPTEPLDPNKDPEDGITEDSGLLTLDYVSSLNFGIHTISDTEETYESLNNRPFIQVSDRRGTGDGWQITAELEEFKNGVSEEASLIGSSITFANGEAVSPGGTTKPVAKDPVKVIAGGAAQPVLIADKGTGQGTWINRWFPKEPVGSTNNSVTLTVPAGTATEGTHKAEIIWTLTDAPQ